MRRFKILSFTIFLLFVACSSSNSIRIETKMIGKAQPRNSTKNVTVFENADNLKASFKEIAIFKTTLFEKNDPEQKIIKAFKNKAREIGANAIIITKNDYSVQARRNTDIGGITTGIERTIEAKAILTN